MRFFRSAFLLLFVFLWFAVSSHAKEVFPIKFVVLVPDMDRTRMLHSIDNELDRLNSHFSVVGTVAFERRPVVWFEDVEESSCELVNHGAKAQSYDFKRWAALIDGCSDLRIVSDGAIVVYVIDAFSEANGFREQNSHGRMNGYRPVLFLDYERVLIGSQNPLVHEMGHAFGLGHVCAVGAVRQSSTNPMASADCGLGSGGMRNLAFDEGQILTIRRNALLINRPLKKS